MFRHYGAVVLGHGASPPTPQQLSTVLGTDVTCVACQHVAECPKVCRSCGALFCCYCRGEEPEDCLQFSNGIFCARSPTYVVVSHCPSCGADLPSSSWSSSSPNSGYVDAPERLARTINSLDVKCRYRSAGCTQIIPFGKLREHENTECDYAHPRTIYWKNVHTSLQAEIKALQEELGLDTVQ
eukprot:PhM_4_TR12976/c0_g1_i2/m.63566